MADSEQFEIDVEQAKEYLDRPDLVSFAAFYISQDGDWADEAHSHKEPVSQQESTRRDLAMLSMHIKSLADHSNESIEGIANRGAEMARKLDEKRE